MRDTLDGVFKALLDEAYDWGAGLLKWGGDALLLLFDGPGHEERACRAAWEMQRTIDRVGRLHVGGGTMTLRMSVGIRTGTFHFFMTGSVHRELLIAGPDHDRDARRWRRSPTPARSASARRSPRDSIRRASARRRTARSSSPRRPTSSAQRAPDVGDVSGLDIAVVHPRRRARPRAAREERARASDDHGRLHRPDGHRRLLERLGPKGSREALDERIRAIQEAALRYEVPFYETDVGKASVKALLTAGAPSSTGHDEERMLRTLREIMDGPASSRCASASTPARSSPATSGRRTDAPTASSATPSTPRPG